MRGSRFFLALTACALFTTAAFAQQPSDQSLVRARDLLQATDAIARVRDVLLALIPREVEAQRKARPDIPPAFFDELEIAYKEEAEANLELLIEPIARLYASRFSEEEIEALLNFYHSDIGKKALAQMPALLQESMKLGDEWGKTVGEKAGRRALDNLRQPRDLPR